VLAEIEDLDPTGGLFDELRAAFEKDLGLGSIPSRLRRGHSRATGSPM
jgi:hypothetical protein